MNVQNKKVVVTGGAGFIGSNLCEALLNANNEVVCYDNLSTGYKSNIESLLDNPNFEFIEGDICDYDKLYSAMGGTNVVFHQAALGSVPRSIENPQATNQVNVSGFITMLDAASNAGVGRVVYASSSSVYGDSSKSPKVESVIGNQLSPYAVSKFTNELYANVYSKVYGMEIIGLRYFNVFGRRQSPDGAYAAAIPRFVKSLLSGESPTIYGDGNQTRDFTYIDNVIHANDLAAVVEDLGVRDKVYNVACGVAISVNQVVDILKRELGKEDESILDINSNFVETRLGDVQQSLASIDRISKDLNYKPIVQFEEGISKAIDWYRNG